MPKHWMPPEIGLALAAQGLSPGNVEEWNLDESTSPPTLLVRMKPEPTVIVEVVKDGGDAQS